MFGPGHGPHWQGSLRPGLSRGGGEALLLFLKKPLPLVQSAGDEITCPLLHTPQRKGVEATLPSSNVLMATRAVSLPISHPPRNTHAAAKGVSQELKGRGGGNVALRRLRNEGCQMAPGSGGW